MLHVATTPVKVVVAGALVLLATAGDADRMRPVAGEKTPEKASVELAFAGYSTRASVALGAPAVRGQVQIDEAFLSLRDVRFRDQDACDATGSAAVPDPILAELITGRTTGGHARSPLRAALYCGLDYTPRRSPGDGAAPGVMRGHAVLVRGQRDDGIRFVIRSRRRYIIRLAAGDPRGFSLPAGKSRRFLAIDLGAWMEGIDLSSLPPGRGRNGVIRIDEGSSREVLHAFEKNLPAGIALFRDDDDDASLSTGERSHERRLASGER